MLWHATRLRVQSYLQVYNQLNRLSEICALILRAQINLASQFGRIS
jgi:hypothetical protein